jgi:hypothetical protein
MSDEPAERWLQIEMHGSGVYTGVNPSYVGRFVSIDDKTFTIMDEEGEEIALPRSEIQRIQELVVDVPDTYLRPADNPEEVPAEEILGRPVTAAPPTYEEADRLLRPAGE